MFMPSNEHPEKLLKVEQIATQLGVNPQTVRKWLREGELKGFLLGKRGGWRVRESDYLDFQRRRSPEPGA